VVMLNLPVARTATRTICVPFPLCAPARTRMGGRARLRGDVVLVEDEHGRVDGEHLTVLLPGPCGLGGDATGTR
jgi:hypothetical protein